MAYKYADATALKQFKVKLLSLIKEKAKIVEMTYTFTATLTSVDQTYSIPNFVSSTDAIDVFKNGFRLIPTSEYSISGTTLKIIGITTNDTQIFVSIKRVQFVW